MRSFELSKIIPVDIPIKEIQDNHRGLKGFERVPKQGTLYWNHYNRRGNPDLILKMYNATANAIDKKMTIIPDIELLKFELKMNNPTKHFGYAVTVQDLIYNEEIINKAYSAMKYYYDEIEKSKMVTLPDRPSADDFILAGLIISSKDPMAEIENLISSCEGLKPQTKYKRRKLIQSKLDSMTIDNDKYKLQL